MNTTHINPSQITIHLIHKWKTAEILELYRTGGWWEMGSEENQIPKIIQGSLFFLLAANVKGEAIGMGRLISDGISDGYIQDIVVFPEYRGFGIGSRIISALQKLGTAYGLSWIGLISAPGKEEFYTRAGFSPMKNYIPMLYGDK